VLPEYRLAAAEKAERLAQAAEASTNAARIANDHGDAYVLKAVIFAIVLFFAGSAPQLRLHSVRAGVLAAGVIICLHGLVGLARLPVQ
jgi:hypothetical protein